MLENEKMEKEGLVCERNYLKKKVESLIHENEKLQKKMTL
jgi:hypothetical protein